MTPMLVGAGIGTLLILLGFVALLTQKRYIDPRTNAPSEIEVPFFGKLKSNYPAVIFVFLGCVLVFLGIRQYKEVRTVEWLIDGSIISNTPGINWQDGQLAIFPSNVDMNLDPQTGKFSIKLDIEEGKNFEQEVERIHYSHPRGSIVILPQTEFDLKQSGNESKLLTATRTSRSYRVSLETMPNAQ
jgi:hypothetical protein